MGVMYKNIGLAIRHYRIKADLSRKDLANLLNVTPSLIAKWENNSRAPKNRIEEICKYLYISPEELFNSCNYKKKKFIDRPLSEILFFVFGVLSLSVLFYSITALIMTNIFFTKIYTLKEIIDVNSDIGYEKMYYFSLINLYSVLLVLSLIALVLAFIFIFLFEKIKSKNAEEKMNKDKNRERRKNYE